jgi:hypothetical protein
LAQAKDKRMDGPRIELRLEGGSNGRPKPSWPVRILEGAGLVAALFGLAAWQPVWIVLGVAAIALSYAIYRKRHGRAGSSDGGGNDGFDSGGDCGGDD